MNFKKVLRIIWRYKNCLQIIMQEVKKQNCSKVILRNGISFNSYKESALFLVEEIFFNKVYTLCNLSIEPNDIVVDIGANIGVFTIFAACKTQKNIYAYEPFHRNFELLNQNIKTNRVSNVITYPAAITDKIGQANLFIADTDYGHLLFDHSIRGKLEQCVEVPAATLKNIMDDNKLERIDFLKIDCEGSEGAIFSSTPAGYIKRIRKIAMEFHDNVSQLKHQDIRRLLEEIGFTTELKWDGISAFGYIYARNTALDGQNS